MVAQGLVEFVAGGLAGWVQEKQDPRAVVVIGGPAIVAADDFGAGADQGGAVAEVREGPADDGLDGFEEEAAAEVQAGYEGAHADSWIRWIRSLHCCRMIQ